MKRKVANLPLRIAFVERYEHADAPHAVALLRIYHERPRRSPRSVMNSRRQIIR
jgi:hypothetical protein